MISAFICCCLLRFLLRKRNNRKRFKQSTTGIDSFKFRIMKCFYLSKNGRTIESVKNTNICYQEERTVRMLIASEDEIDQFLGKDKLEIKKSYV